MNKIRGVLELLNGVTWLCVFEAKNIKDSQLKELVELANFYYKSGETQDAITYYKQALKVLECAPVYNNLGLAYLQNEELGKAAHALQRALRLDGSCVHALYNLSIVMYSSSNFDKGIEFLSYIIKWSNVPATMLINAHNDSGCAHMRKNDQEKAIKSFETALVLDPKFVKAYVNLGNVFCEQGTFEDAMKYFNKAIGLNSNCAAAYNGLGVIYFNQGKLDIAQDYFDKAMHTNAYCSAAKINQHLIKKYADPAQDAKASMQESM